MLHCRVLNTRPAHQAETLKRAIENGGGFVFNLPVFEIQSVVFQAENIDEFDYIIFLSTNAVVNYFKKTRTLPHAFLLAPEKTECVSHVSATFHADQKEIQQKRTQQGARIIAIGPATKYALEKQGAHDVICPSLFNSDGILLLPEMQSIQNKKIAIISGENSKSTVSEILKQRGADVTSIICYRRIPIVYDMNLIFKKLSEFDIHFIISTSLESYFALMTLFKHVDHRKWLLQKTICVISDQMMQQAKMDGFVRVREAKNATDEAIIGVLSSSIL